MEREADVSIHAPLAGCDQERTAALSNTYVSIHAPLAGCDRAELASLFIHQVSIHAPLAGCDLAEVLPKLFHDLFQSTHPSRGATFGTVVYTPHIAVSIHAPLAGCDVRSDVCLTVAQCFNPRTPRGVRRIRAPPHAEERSFNPRTPRGVRLLLFIELLASESFQSTHPSRGATPMQQCKTSSYGGFNPRTPRGVRPCNTHQKGRRCDVSIHAPLAGCDTVSIGVPPIHKVSIHAPLAGCDNP